MVNLLLEKSDIKNKDCSLRFIPQVSGFYTLYQFLNLNLKRIIICINNQYLQGLFIQICNQRWESFLEQTKFFVEKDFVQKKTNDGQTKWIFQRNVKLSFLKTNGLKSIERTCKNERIFGTSLFLKCSSYGMNNFFEQTIVFYWTNNSSEQTILLNKQFYSTIDGK